MTLSRLHIGVFVALAAAIWAAVLLSQGQAITLALAAPFGIVVSVLTLCWLVVEHWLWRQSWLHGWFFNRPDLRGTWKGILQSDWIDPDTNARIAPIVCYFGVKQSLGTLQMHLMTPQSESWLKGGSLKESPNEMLFEIVAVYENRPGLVFRDKSPMHRGAVAIETHGPNSLRPSAMSGEYWTDRKTKGTLEFDSRINETHTRFQDAEVAFRKANR